MSPAERLKVLLFLALFFGAIGVLSTLLSCGTEYWLLAAESCGPPDGGGGGAEAAGGVRIFHEGLFWRCSFSPVSPENSALDLWILNQPSSKVCQPAFLFPFPANEPWAEPHRSPAGPYEHHSAIVFRTFWSIFLVAGVAAVVAGAFTVVCAASLSNARLYNVAGALQLSGGVCLLAVLLMYVMWVQVLDTLEQFALRRRASGCPSFHLSVQHGPSFLLAPVAVFFCLLAGLLVVLIGRRMATDSVRVLRRNKTPERPAPPSYFLFL